MHLLWLGLLATGCDGRGPAARQTSDAELPAAVPPESVTVDRWRDSGRPTGSTPSLPGPPDTGSGTGVATGDTGSDPVLDTAGPLGIVSVDVYANPVLVLERTIEVRTNLPTTASLTCTSFAVPAEDHRLVAPVPATIHVFVVGGLLPATSYQCTATASAAGEVDSHVAAFLVSTLPFARPGITATPTVAEVAHTYTLLNHRGAWEAHNLILLDPEGQVRWYREVPVGLGLEAISGPPGLLLYGGGLGVRPRFVTPSSVLVWVGPGPANGGVHHHDVSLTPVGDVVTLSSSTNSDGPQTWEGFRVEVVAPYTGDLLFGWDSQIAVAAGALPPGEGDAYHANAVAWIDDDEGAGFIVSLARLNRILRVDAATGAVLWQIGAGQDFALLDAQGDPEPDDSRWFYFQHGPDYDGTRLLLHDNGKDRPGPGPPYSRALELVLDHGARTARVAWAWREAGWFEPIMGDTDWLANGNVLVTQGHSMGADLRRTGWRSSIVEIDAATLEVVHRLTFDAVEDLIYRAERLDGCSLFHNRRYCPDPD